MKIKNEHYERLKAALDKALEGFGQAQKEDYFRYNPKATETRFLWDVYWHSTRYDERLLGGMYEYLNDSNIETALKYYFKNHWNK